MATRRPNGTGKIRHLPSGRWQAMFRGPDDVLRPAPMTFDSKIDAAGWLKNQMVDVDRGRWAAPSADQRQPRRRGLTVDAYATSWLATRELKPRTRALYRGILDRAIVPTLGDELIDRVTPATVRAWYAQLDSSKPTSRAHAYGLLRAIFRTAVLDDVVPASPCKIRGAGASKTVHKTRIAALPELDLVVEATPARLRLMMLLAAWCGLRFGELAELRRGDVDVDGRAVRIERAVTRVGGKNIVGSPKSDAGVRRVSIPPHLMAAVRAHLAEHTEDDATALLFPAVMGGNMSASALQKTWRKARVAAGRPDLRFHDLRHTGATLAGQMGATLPELMNRLGHSTPQAAMKYQHASADRDAAIAEALSGFAAAKVVPLRQRSRVKSS